MTSHSKGEGVQAGVTTGVVLYRIFMFVVSDPSILPIWPLLIAYL